MRRVALRSLAVRARGGVSGLDGLLVGEVEHGRAAEPVGFGDVRGVDVGGPGAQGGGGGPRRGGQRPQQRQRRPVPDPLPQLAAVGIADGLAGVLQHVGEQFLVGRGQQVGPFLAQPVLREGCRLPGIGADVAAAALHEVAGEPLPALDRFEVDGGQARVQQRQQVAEPFLLAAVRGGGDQDQVPGGVLGQAGDELVAEHPGPAAGAVGDAGVRLVDDQQVRAAVPELLAEPRALDEVGGHHDVAEPVEEGLALQQAAFQPADRAGQHQLGVDAELAGQLLLPLLGERGAAEHGQAGRVALLQQLGGGQAGLDGLADADVVGDQQPHRVLPQRHQQRDELVGAGFDGEPGQRPERPGAGPEADPQGRAQQPGARRGADVLRVRRREGGRADLLQRGEYAGDLVVGSGQGAQTRKSGGCDCGRTPTHGRGPGRARPPRTPEAPSSSLRHLCHCEPNTLG